MFLLLVTSSDCHKIIGHSVSEPWSTAKEQELSEPHDMQPHGKAVMQRGGWRHTLVVLVTLGNQTASVQPCCSQVPDLGPPWEGLQPRWSKEDLLTLEVVGPIFLPYQMTESPISFT